MTARWIGIFPIICVIIIVISLFLPIMHLVIDIPAVPLTVEGDIMPLGGGLIDELQPYIALSPEASNLQNTFMWVGIAFAVFYGLDALLLLINGIKVITGRKELKKARKKWLTGGLGKIISQIVIIIVMITVVPSMLVDNGVILSFTIALGMILTMVTGGILIFAYICAKIAD